MPRWSARVDENQKDIVDALRTIGCSVVSLHRVGAGVSDLLVGKFGKNFLLEVKSEHGKLNERQSRFFEEWQGQKAVVRTAQQAIDVIMDAVED